jgi:uncharacterized protein (TIGR04255 family)
MTHLPNAPLIYTIAIVRFPSIPAMDRFVPLFHDEVRGEYPHRDEMTLHQMRVDFGPNGVNIDPVPLTVWQFASPDRKLALVLSSNSLALHTIAYKDNQTFLEAFRSALLKLIAIPQVGIDWTDGVAMRYVDLVKSIDGKGLDQLLKPSVLPPPFVGVADLNIVEGVYLARYKTTKADVRFQILRNPLTALPPDLITPLLQLNNWQFERPSTGEFAVIDTDCSLLFSNAVPMDIEDLCRHMYELRFVAKSIFENIGTEYAVELWRKET